MSGTRVYATTNDSELDGDRRRHRRGAWTHQAIAEPARILSASSVAVDGETVVAPFASGEVTALLAANGRRLWTDSLSRIGRLTSLSAINDIAGRPVIDSGVVYAASHSGVLAAIDLRTGQRVWARAFASTQTPWVVGRVLYAVSVDGELAAFSRATGGVHWMTPIAPLRERARAQGPRRLGRADHGGRAAGAWPIPSAMWWRLPPRTAKPSRSTDVGQPVFIPPIAANEQIYIVTDDARLVVLR